MKTVLITGASGFIGSALVRAFSAKGWRVVGAGRTQPPALPDGVEWRTYDLAWTSLPDDFLEGVDAVVHGAMMKQSADERSFDINVAAGKMLLDRAHQRDITRVAFLSSLAAHEVRYRNTASRSTYSNGISTSAAHWSSGPVSFSATAAYSHRCATTCARIEYVPLIGGGNQPLQTIYIDDLTERSQTAVDRDHKGAFTAAEDEPVSYRRFYEDLCASLGAK